jgi:RNA polymerase sigma-70 factor, ECF subfamily
MRVGQRARDEWLALRCQAAEPSAFEALIAEMERPLFFYLLQLIRNQDQAQELLQETWIRALKTFKKLKDPGAVRAWLYTLAHGIAVDHVRRDQVRHRAEEYYVDDGEMNAEPDLTGLTAAEVREVLTRLCPEHREVLVLHFLEDFPIAEIASIVRCPPGTVKSRIHHAKAQLKQILLEKGYGT